MHTHKEKHSWLMSVCWWSKQKQIEFKALQLTCSTSSSSNKSPKAQYSSPSGWILTLTVFYIADWQNYGRSMHIVFVCHCWIAFLLSSNWFVLVVLPDMHVFNFSLALKKGVRVHCIFVSSCHTNALSSCVTFFISEFATQVKSRMTLLSYRNLLLAC